MGMPRRADITDRGRRWIPKNGKYGKITLTTNGASIYINMNTTDSVLQSWTYSDGTVTDNQPTVYTHNYAPSSPPNTATCVPTDSVNLVNFSSATNADLISVALDKRLTNMLTMCIRSLPNLTMIETHGTWTALKEIQIWGDKLSSFQTHAWPALEELIFHSNYSNGGGITSMDTFETWNLVKLQGYNEETLSSFETYNWPNLGHFYMSKTDLGPVIETHPWPSINYINVSNIRDGGLTSFETHNTWTNLTFLALNINSINSVELHDTWSSLTTFYINQNSDVSLTWPASGLTALDTVFAYSCNWSGSEIDDMVIALDGYGVSNGELRYNSNPNSADSNRSASANTALANLVSRGWTIYK